MKPIFREIAGRRGRADSALRTAGRAGRRKRDRGSAVAGGREVARTAAGAGATLGVSAASLCHVAWAQVLAKVSGREDVVFGTVLFGRMQGGEGADRVMGMFINTLPVRIAVGEEGVEASVRGAHNCWRSCCGTSMRRWRWRSGAAGCRRRAPLFSALLNYRHSSSADQARLEERKRAWEGIKGLRGEERTQLSHHSFGRLTWEQDLDWQRRSSRRLGRCGYASTCTRRWPRWWKRWRNRQPCLCAGFNVLPAAEREQLLYGWNRTEQEFPARQCVHELFEEQVERAPNAVAVVFEEEQLSYGELNRRANQLAHYLRELGVKPDERVAICAGARPGDDGGPRWRY